MTKITSPEDDADYQVEIANKIKHANEQQEITSASIKNETSIAQPMIYDIEHKIRCNFTAKTVFIVTLLGTNKMIADLFPLTVFVHDINGIVATSLNALLTGYIATFSVLSVALIEKIARALVREEYLKTYNAVNRYNDTFLIGTELVDFDKALSVSSGKINEFDEIAPDKIFFKEPKVTAFTWIGIIGLLIVLIPMLIKIIEVGVFTAVSLILGLLISSLMFMICFGIIKNTGKLLGESFSSFNTFVINQAGKFDLLTEIYFVNRKIKDKVQRLYTKKLRWFYAFYWSSYLAVIIFSISSAKSYTLAIPFLKTMTLTFGRTQIPVGAVFISSLLLIVIKESFSSISFNKLLNSYYFRDFCRNSVLSKNTHEAIGVVIRDTDDFYEKKLTKFYIFGFLAIIGEFIINNMVNNYLSYEDVDLISQISLFLAPLASAGIGLFLGFKKAFVKAGEKASEIQTEEEFCHKKKNAVMLILKQRKNQEAEKKKNKKLTE